MKARLIMLLCACSNAYAEPWPLPPVVDNSVYPSEANAPKSPSTNTLLELMGRLEQMQAEVQQLTGKVEEQGYQIIELQKRQKTMFSDFDERIQSIESKAATGADAATENPQEPAAPEVDAEAKAVDSPAPTPAPASAPTPATPAAAPAPKQADSESTSTDEKQQYQQAYEALRNGQTDQAIAAFNALISRNPSGVFANNAQYWLGEAYKVKQEINSARNAFKGVIENYPGSSKVPDALLKLGYIEYEQKNWSKAREYLTRVTTEFPDSTAAHLATKRLFQMDDAKH
jgi:tol-pal system protein YbgF